MAELLIFFFVITVRASWFVLVKLLELVIYVLALTISAAEWIIDRHREKERRAEEADENRQAFYSTRR